MANMADVVDSYTEKLPLASESLRECLRGSAKEVISEEWGGGGHTARALRAEVCGEKSKQV